MNVRNYYVKFKKIGSENNCSAGFVRFLKYLKLRVSYKVSMQDFFSERLYDKSVDHFAYFNSLHTAIHKWAYVRPRFVPNATVCKRIFMQVDYYICKLLYPGLDAMDYFRYEFYNIGHSKRREFITEGYLVKMDRYFNGGAEKIADVNLLRDKGRFNEKFKDFVQRKWILTKGVSQTEFESFCLGLDKVIVKPIDGGAGHGVHIVELNFADDVAALYEEVKNTNSIVEEVIVQHDDIRRLNPSSVNTIRVYSVLYNGEVYITGATLRIGCGDTPIDNYSAGGVAAEIDVDSGLVISPAVSQNAEKYLVHPYSNAPIKGLQIPFWQDIIANVKSAHALIPRLGYIGWDVAVCADNTITFLEANTCSGVALQQHPGLKGKKPVYMQFMK